MYIPYDIYMGVDLGQKSDFSSVAIIKLHDDRTMHLKYLNRYPLGTSYPAIVSDISRRLQVPELRGRTMCIADKTGVGAPVVDLLEQQCSALIVPLTITNGQRPKCTRHEYWVPKRDLATRLQVLLETRKLGIPPSLPSREALLQEMANFSVKINVATGDDQYEALHSGEHDDMVLALAMACWVAQDCWERNQKTVQLLQMQQEWDRAHRQAQIDAWLSNMYGL